MNTTIAIAIPYNSFQEPRQITNEDIPYSSLARNFSGHIVIFRPTCWSDKSPLIYSNEQPLPTIPVT